MCIEDAYIRLQLQQRRDDILRLQHLWLTPLVSSVPYTSHVNAANALANGDTSQQLTWLPLIVTLPSEDFARFLITNNNDGDESDESDDSDTEELDEVDGTDNMGQVLLVEALEAVGKDDRDEDDGGAQLSALKAAIWQTPVSMYLTAI